MAAPLTLAKLEAAFKKWGVIYDLFDDQVATRGRRDFTVQYGVMNHHTGSDSGQSEDYDAFLFVRGRPEEGIPAPLCHISGDMDGDVHIGAMRVANHAGSGSSSTLNKIKNGYENSYNQEIIPGPDDINGNDFYLGIEWKYDGGQPPTAAMWDSMVRVNTAICEAQGWTPLAILGHREHTKRKLDPGNVFMYMLRRAVLTLMKAGPDGGTISMTEAAAINANIDRFEATEANRYARYEAMHKEQKAWHDSLVAAEAERYQRLESMHSEQRQWHLDQMNSFAAIINSLNAVNGTLESLVNSFPPCSPPPPVV